MTARLIVMSGYNCQKYNYIIPIILFWQIGAFQPSIDPFFILQKNASNIISYMNGIKRYSLSIDNKQLYLETLRGIDKEFRIGEQYWSFIQ